MCRRQSRLPCPERVAAELAIPSCGLLSTPRASGSAQGRLPRRRRAAGRRRAAADRTPQQLWSRHGEMKWGHARTWPNFWVSEQAKVETPILASSSPETSEMAGGGTRKRAGSFRSPSYCIMPTNRVCAYAHTQGRRRQRIPYSISERPVSTSAPARAGCWVSCIVPTNRVCAHAHTQGRRRQHAQSIHSAGGGPGSTRCRCASAGRGRFSTHAARWAASERLPDRAGEAPALEGLLADLSSALLWRSLLGTAM